MKSIRVRVPLRVDLAGGTLDLWPLYLFHPGARTVNLAISIFAECEVQTTSTPGITVVYTDEGLERHYADAADLIADPSVAVIARAIEHLHITGIRIITRTEAPRGSGLGGSSALTIALVRALTEAMDSPVEGEELINLVRDLETRLLGVPAGIQDYYPPVFGGLASLHLEPGRPVRTALPLTLSDLGQHLIVYYSGIAHFSGTNNWEIYRRQIDKDPEVIKGLRTIADIAIRMESALEDRDYEAAGAALRDEWEARRKLFKGISNDEIEGAIADALAAGAWGGKVCGAGGGGCMIFLVPADRRDAVIDVLSKRSGRVLPVTPVGNGLVIETTESEEPAAEPRRRTRTSNAWFEPLEQFVIESSDRSALRPWLLAEIAVRWDDPRVGGHLESVRTLAAPYDMSEDHADWSSSIELAPDALSLEKIEAGELPKSLTDVAPDAVDELFDLLLERERLTILHNPSLDLYSAPDEDRGEFLARCMEVALRVVEDQESRLESTFRRRIDQMRERSERDQLRKNAENEDPATEIRTPDVAISWGQALYKITTGRPAASDDPQSVDEADVAQKIAQLQRQWERETEQLRQEQEERARAIEELPLLPSRRNLDLLRLAVVWASRFPEAALASSGRGE